MIRVRIEEEQGGVVGAEFEQVGYYISRVEMAMDECMEECIEV